MLQAGRIVLRFLLRQLGATMRTTECTCQKDWGKYEPTCSDYENCARQWRPIETAPKDGTPFLATVVDTVDEYDEDDRLIAKGKREVGVWVAQQIEFLGAPVVIPWTGSIVQNRKFTHWMPLPKPPVP